MKGFEATVSLSQESASPDGERCQLSTTLGLTLGLSTGEVNHNRKHLLAAETDPVTSVESETAQ